MELFADPITVNCRKVLAGLQMMDADYTLTKVDYFKGEQKNDEFKSINPNAALPALKDGDLVLWESNAILQYVADTMDKTEFYPKDPAKRADVNRSKYETKTMSFAVIQTGGKQYKVSASEILKIERLDSQVGKTVEFKNVLFLNDDKNTEIGNPNIKGAKVEATILKNTKNRTVLVFKKRRRKNSRKKYGHRQPITLIKITKIFSKEGKIIAQEEMPKKTSTNVLKKSASENKVEKPKKIITDVKKRSVISKKK